MSIARHDELKLAIARWLGREELTARIPEFIALCEDRIALDLRVRAMETSADLTINAQRVSEPTGFLEQIRLYRDSSDQKGLEYFDTPVFWTRGFVNESGTPIAYTIEGQEFVFAPNPSSTHTGKILYYKRFTALSADSDTNWALTNLRGLYLYGALLEAYTFLEDDAGQLKYASLFEDIVERANQASRRGRFPRGAQSSRSQVSVV